MMMGTVSFLQSRYELSGKGASRKALNQSSISSGTGTNSHEDRTGRLSQIAQGLSDTLMTDMTRQTTARIRKDPI